MGDAAEPSGIARLAGGRVPRERLGREAILQADRHSARRIGRPPIDHAGEAGEGSRRTACSAAARASAWMRRWSATTRWPPAARSSPKMGGPSAKPYQPERRLGPGRHAESNTRNYKQDTGENLYRRTLYTSGSAWPRRRTWTSSTRPAARSACVRRERTNTPLQALVTLNDPQFVEAARNLAQTGAARCRRRRRQDASTTSRAACCAAR